MGAFVATSAVAGLVVVAQPAAAHRSGCHAAHSCPSDTGSYVCGDTGNFNFCPAATPTTVNTAGQTSGDVQGSRIVSSSPSGPAVTATPTVAASTRARAVSATSGLATTGLNHTTQFIELAIVLLGLGTALVLEIRARDGLDTLRRQ